MSPHIMFTAIKLKNGNYEKSMVVHADNTEKKNKP